MGKGQWGIETPLESEGENAQSANKNRVMENATYKLQNTPGANALVRINNDPLPKCGGVNFRNDIAIASRKVSTPISPPTRA